MTIRETLQKTRSRLIPAVGEDEAAAMARVILEDIKGYDSTMLVLNADKQLLDETVQRIDRIVERVINGEPLQYIIGKAYFHGRMYKVDPSVLIPRPETSQLIDIITDRYRNTPDLRILDIGTGTGCIAITLALDLPFADVKAIDISAPALATARENASAMKANVQFSEADILNPSPVAIDCDTFDIIVSNPPYVLESEKATMEHRVTDHEPSSALFVPDSNPLLFYKPIAAYAAGHLADNGTLWLEINPMCAEAIRSLLVSTGFRDVDIIRDYKGTNRFATATK